MIRELNLVVLLSFLYSALGFLAFIKKLVKGRDWSKAYSKSGSFRMGFSGSHAKKASVKLL